MKLDTFEYERIKALRAECLRRDDFVCFYCKKKGTIRDMGICPNKNGTKKDELDKDDMVTLHIDCNDPYLQE